MATDSDIKLTKFKSTVTVVTSDFANSFFGGLYGSPEAESLDEDDARVRGHIHDGLRGDGHAPKIHLLYHVTDELTNPNLGDDAVMARNVLDTKTISNAIPEYRVDPDFPDEKYYYLDLRHMRADFVFQEDEDPGIGQHKLIKQRDKTWNDLLSDGAGEYEEIEDVWDTDEGFDFVFGSSSLDNLNSGSNGDSRLQFDKSKSAFRAGRVEGNQWDQNNRGDDSVAFGHNTEATGTASTVSGGGQNKAEALRSTVSGGYNNVSSGKYSNISGGLDNKAAAKYASVSGGYANEANEQYSGVGSGYLNKAVGSHSRIGGGEENIASGDKSFVGSGEKNTASGDNSSVSSGFFNEASGDTSFIGGGSGNKALGLKSFVGAGNDNEVSGDGVVCGGERNTSSSSSFVGGGTDNKAIPPEAVVVGAVAVGGNKNEALSMGTAVVGGWNNTVESQLSFVGGGEGNSILQAGWPDGPSHSVIGGGENNNITGKHSSILGGNANEIKNTSDKSSILGGSGSWIDGHCSIIGGGDSNIVDAPGAPDASGYGVVGGGKGNSVLSSYASVLGGESNTAHGLHSVVVGGIANSTKADNTAILGGWNNMVNAANSSIVGGDDNVIDAMLSTITGGQSNEIQVGAKKSTIVGGASNKTTGFHSAIVGGDTNEIKTSQYAVIVGGTNNNVTESNISIAVGGDHSTIQSSDRCIIAGVGDIGKTKHEFEYIPLLEIDTDGDDIPDTEDGPDYGFSNYQTLTIGAEYTSFLGRPIPASPSDSSGIFGGHTNHIVGGATAPDGERGHDNYIVGGSDNRMGGELYNDAAISSSQIFGGSNNEMLAIEGTDKFVWIRHGLLVGGSANSILLGGPSRGCSDILYSGVFGGHSNNINSVGAQGERFGTDGQVYDHPGNKFCKAPWFEPFNPVTGDGHWNRGDCGVQTSYIFGGTRNTITNQRGPDLKDHSLYSAILGGQNNIINSSYGSSILGGGAFVQYKDNLPGDLVDDTDGDGNDDPLFPVIKPPYDLVDEYYSNVIDGGHHSTILNGSSNLIRQYSFPWSGDGPTWVEKVEDDRPDPWSEPVFCIAQGRESYSYLYGQRAYASGGHTFEKFGHQDFSPASNEHQPNMDGVWKTHLGSHYNEDLKGPVNQPGTAQASVLTFFGSWDYKLDNIGPDLVVDPSFGNVPKWIPDGSTGDDGTYFKFKAYLDGGRDNLQLPGSDQLGECFKPRFPGSYNIVINGAISYSWVRGSQQTHEMISFTYTGNIAVGTEGGGKYSGRLTNIVSSSEGFHTLSLCEKGGAGTISPTDFSIAFGPVGKMPHEIYNSSFRVQPATHNHGNVENPPGFDVPNQDYVYDFKVQPDWIERHGSWNTYTPPGFCIHVVNNSGEAAQIGGNGTGNRLVGESLVARADIVENLLYLGRYNNDPS